MHFARNSIALLTSKKHQQYVENRLTLLSEDERIKSKNLHLGANYVRIKRSKAMKHLFRLYLLLMLTCFFPQSQASGEVIEHKGIVYEKKGDSQLAIKGFARFYNGVIEIARHVTINRQEFTVSNLNSPHAIDFYYADSVAIPEFAFDLIMPSDLRKMKNLRYLKIDAQALEPYRDYRLIAKHLTGDYPVFLDFYRFPPWAKLRHGVHYSTDGSTLLYTGSIRPNTNAEHFYPSDRVKQIAPYALGAAWNATFLILPSTIRSISASQIMRKPSTRLDKDGLQYFMFGSKCFFLVIDNCSATPSNIEIIDPEDGPDPDYQFKLFFVTDLIGETRSLHVQPWATKSKYVEWGKAFPAFTTGAEIHLGHVPANLTISSITVLPRTKYRPKQRIIEPDIHRQLTQDTSMHHESPLESSKFGERYWRYKLEPTSDPSIRLLGYILTHVTPPDTIRTSDAFCWWGVKAKISPIYAVKDQYVEGFDYLLSDDKRTLTWWKNSPEENDISHLNIPGVTRCGENFLTTPPSSGSYTFPAQITQVGPRAISNVSHLRELVVDHDLTLEKSSLSGCKELLIIKCLNDSPLSENTIRDAFFPDPIPANLVLTVPKRNEAQWASVRDKLGAPLITVEDTIFLINRNRNEAAMRIRWKENLFATAWHEVANDSIALPGFALFKVDFDPLPRYDFDSICTLNDNSTFNYNDTLLASRSLAIFPKCHLVKYPVRFSPFADGSISIETVVTKKLLDSGAYVERHTDVVFRAFPNVHFRFARFLVNGQSVTQNPYTKTVRSPLDVIAFFRPILHAATFDAKNECAWEVLNADSIPVPYHVGRKGIKTLDSLAENAIYTFRPIPPEGRTVEQAFINGYKLHGPDTTLSVQGPVALYATTKAKTCFIRVPDPELYDHLQLSLAANTPVRPNSPIPWGETLTIHAVIAKRFFTFNAIIVNGVAYQKERISIAAQADTLTLDLEAEPINFVVYIAPDYRFDAEVSSPMPISSDPAYPGMWGVIPDQPITISLKAKPGWMVKTMNLIWQEGNEESLPGAYKQCDVRSDLSVEPVLERIFYHIDLPAKKKAGSILAYGKQQQPIKATTKLAYGDSITILPQSNNGYELKSLALNGELIPPRQTQIEVTGDISVSAIFDKISYKKSDSLVLDHHDSTLRFAGYYKRHTLDFHSPTLKSVSLVASEACAFNPHIETAIILGNVSTIESRAFFGCSRLRNVTIGPSVRYIGAQAFAETDRLEVIEIQQTNPDSLTLDPAIFQTTRGASAHYVFRVPNEAYDAFQKHPKWQHVSVVPRTVEWTFELEASDFQLNATIFGFNGEQQHLAITQGRTVLPIPGGSQVAISSSSAAAQTITHVAFGEAIAALPCANKALNSLTVTVSQHQKNLQRKTDAASSKRPTTLAAIAPNPSSRNLYITPTSPRNMGYALFNAKGSCVMQGDIANGSPTRIDIRTLVPGIYILHIICGSERQVQAIVKP